MTRSVYANQYIPVKNQIAIKKSNPNQYIVPSCYSTYEPLNHFESNTEGTLGYVSPEEKEAETVTIGENETAEKAENGIQSIQSSITKETPLWLPKNKTCTIKVTSTQGEKTGNICLTLSNGQTKTAEYDYINQEYVLDVNGKGETATLTINGFWSSYEIELTNAEVYNNQDTATETETQAEATTES